MKSNKQRKSEIKQKRWKRMEACRAKAVAPSVSLMTVPADMERLEQLHGSVWWHPAYYEDKHYECRDCGAECVWTAQSQKWWHEEAQGHLHSGVQRCAPCNAKHRAWRLSHCDAQEMAALRALWRVMPDADARLRVEQALAARDPALRCLAAQALAWWWVQWDDAKAHERLETVAIERTWAPRIQAILEGQLALRAGLHRPVRVWAMACEGS